MLLLHICPCPTHSRNCSSFPHRCSCLSCCCCCCVACLGCSWCWSSELSRETAARLRAPAQSSQDLTTCKYWGGLGKKYKIEVVIIWKKQKIGFICEKLSISMFYFSESMWTWNAAIKWSKVLTRLHKNNIEFLLRIKKVGICCDEYSVIILILKLILTVLNLGLTFRFFCQSVKYQILKLGWYLSGVRFFFVIYGNVWWNIKIFLWPR